MGYLDGRAWIDLLPQRVAPQAALLMRLLEAVEADQRVRALEIKGSMARGTADEYSDLDTGGEPATSAPSCRRRTIHGPSPTSFLPGSPWIWKRASS